MLVARGLIAQDEVDALVESGVDPGQRIGASLVNRLQVDERAVTDALARQYGLQTIDLRAVAPMREAAAVLPEATALALDVLPIQLSGTTLVVAISDPLDERVPPALAALPVETVQVHLAAPSDIQSAIYLAYRALSEVDAQVRAFATSEAQSVQDEAPAAADAADAPIIQVVNKILTQARRDRASDVHIEPVGVRVRVRFRIDGALKEVLSLPTTMSSALVSRIKIMANMNIVERRRAQDGQFAITLDGRELDVRVSTTSTIWGEKAVMRLLDKSKSLFRLGQLGMPADLHETFSKIVRSPFGMVICSGPTGSGKTTTLYATLSEINNEELNVMTVEDPVEYVFPEINQIQINEQADLTFAAGLKGILRQDPDVILVGEVRDVETARIAVQSALTGHFVLSSIHATDAASALYRLLDMGIEPFLVASSVIAVVGQRLVRRICRSCAEWDTLTAQEQVVYDELGGRPKEKFLKGTGCNFCGGTGYRERVGVFEVLHVTDEIRHLVVSGAMPHVTRELAVRQGMRTLRQEALRLVEEDVTSVAEILRNVYGA
jgi:type IV pilus assembly protein PilB